MNDRRTKAELLGEIDQLKAKIDFATAQRIDTHHHLLEVEAQRDHYRDEASRLSTLAAELTNEVEAARDNAGETAERHRHVLAEAVRLLTPAAKNTRRDLSFKHYGISAQATTEVVPFEERIPF